MVGKTRHGYNLHIGIEAAHHPSIPQKHAKKAENSAASSAFTIWLVLKTFLESKNGWAFKGGRRQQLVVGSVRGRASCNP
jgi:hypothetical protein